MRPAPTGYPGRRRDRSQPRQTRRRFLVEVFGKVEQRSSDQAVNRMDGAVRRMPQGDDQDLEPASLQGQNLLGDKGFGEPRIAL